MPFIKVTSNIVFSSNQVEQIRLLLGQKMCLLSGKTEESLMVIFQQGEIVLRGCKPAAIFLEISSFDPRDRQSYPGFAREVNQALALLLDLSPMAIYSKFDSIQSWSVGQYVMENQDD